MQRYVFIMGLATLVCWLSLGIVILRIDPYTAGSIGLLLFFVAVFFACWGTLSLIGFGMRAAVLKSTPLFAHVGISLRQAIWFAILLCLTLFLISQRLYEPWMPFVLIIALASIEIFFLLRHIDQRPRRRNRRPN